MGQQWMSIVEYARFFNISDMTVRRRIKTGRIPAELKDGKYYIPVDLQDSQPMTSLSNSRTPMPSNRNGLKFSPGHGELEVSRANSAVIRPTMQAPQRRSSVVNKPEVIPQQISTTTDYSSQSEANEAVTKTLSIQEEKEDSAKWQKIDELISLCSKAIELKESYETEVKAKNQEQLETLEAKIELVGERVNQLSQKFEDLQILIQMMDEQGD